MKVFLTLSSLLVAATALTSTAAPAARPNIIVMMVDSCEAVKNVELQGSVSLWETASDDANST